VGATSSMEGVGQLPGTGTAAILCMQLGKTQLDLAHSEVPLAAGHSAAGAAGIWLTCLGWSWLAAMSANDIQGPLARPYVTVCVLAGAVDVLGEGIGVRHSNFEPEQVGSPLLFGTPQPSHQRRGVRRNSIQAVRLTRADSRTTRKRPSQSAQRLCSLSSMHQQP
jgi:hypothetical protein